MSFGAEHLAEPDLFPARRSGESWGAERVVARFAGNDYVCEGLSATQAAGLRAKFGSLCVPAPDGARPTVVLAVYRTAASDFVGDERGWDFDFDLDYAPRAIRLAGFHVMGRLDWAPHLSAALWTCEDEALVSRSILENVLRIVVAHHLLDLGGVLLHSAAFVDDGGAHVFFGPSGAGKSTISRLAHAAGHGMLSDDINALRITRDGVRVEKLPFAGEFGQSIDTVNGCYPVRSLCRLRKGADPALAGLGAAAGVAALVECAPFVNRNPFRHDALVATLEAVHVRVPVRVLTFALDRRFLALLDLQSAA